MKRIGKYLTVAFCCIVIACGGLLTACAPDDDKVGGLLEKKYKADGDFSVKYVEYDADDATFKHEIYYPEELETSDKEYPVIQFIGDNSDSNNAILEHWATHGFVVIGNSSSTLEAADSSLSYLLKAYYDESSLFYGKIDSDNIGVCGYAKGGVDALQAILENPYGSSYYKAAVVISPAYGDNQSCVSDLDLDLENVMIPIFIVTTDKSESGYMSVSELETLHGRLCKNDDAYYNLYDTTILAVKNGCKQRKMLSATNGYTTAWFVWQLQNVSNVKSAFCKEEIVNEEQKDASEININELYTVVKKGTGLSLSDLMWGLAYGGNMCPLKYSQTVTTGGALEARYLAKGSYEVERVIINSGGQARRHVYYYPTDLKTSSEQYPVVVMVNGTGVGFTRYTAMFEHLASWGFIVAGNEDWMTGVGTTAEDTLAELLLQNENPNSIFCNKVDTNNIGGVGHSQGGTGVINAASNFTHSNMYKTVVSLSPSGEDAVQNNEGLKYNPTKISVPIFIVAAENDGVNLSQLTSIYNRVNTNGKVLVRRKGIDHGKALYSVDGYVTAWLCWHLKGDSEAAKAFVGNDAEILTNSLYRDAQSGFTD